MFAEQEISPNLKAATLMYVTTEADVLKDGGVLGANVPEVTKVLGVNKLHGHSGAKVGPGTHP